MEPKTFANTKGEQFAAEMQIQEAREKGKQVTTVSISRRFVYLATYGPLSQLSFGEARALGQILIDAANLAEESKQ